MPKCDFNKVAPTLLNHTSAWVFSCNRPIGTGGRGGTGGWGLQLPQILSKVDFLPIFNNNEKKEGTKKHTVNLLHIFRTFFRRRALDDRF